MSYNIRLMADVGGASLVPIEGAEWNYTYNIQPMLKEAGMDSLYGVIHTLNASQALLFLSAALRRLREDPEKYKAMNPKNGWGSYDGLVDLLEQLEQSAKCMPFAIFNIS